jgi:hypothetical protein
MNIIGPVVIIVLLTVLLIIFAVLNKRDTSKSLISTIEERAVNCEDLCDQLAQFTDCGPNRDSCCVCESAVCSSLPKYQANCNPSVDDCVDIYPSDCSIITPEDYQDLIGRAVRLVGRREVDIPEFSGFTNVCDSRCFTYKLKTGSYYYLRVTVELAASGTDSSSSKWDWILNMPNPVIVSPPANIPVYSGTSQFNVSEGMVATMEWLVNGGETWDVQVKHSGRSNNRLVYRKAQIELREFMDYTSSSIPETPGDIERVISAKNGSHTVTGELSRILSNTSFPNLVSGNEYIINISIYLTATTDVSTSYWLFRLNTSDLTTFPTSNLDIRQGSPAFETGEGIVQTFQFHVTPKKNAAAWQLFVSFDNYSKVSKSSYRAELIGVPL